MQDNSKKYELDPCIVKIEKWFESDAIILLDSVLTDDSVEPEYSANTAYLRLEMIVDFHKLYLGEVYRDVSDYLLKHGYTNEDVDLLNKKRIDEDQRKKTWPYYYELS